jgi:hypothetical protein
MPNFLSHKLGTETILPNTSATNGFPQPYSGMSMDLYPGRPSPPSPLNDGSTLSTAGPSAHDLGPSSPPSDHPTPYTGPSDVIQSPPHGSQVFPTRPDSPGIVPDRPIHSQTVRLHRSDRPEHQKSPVIRLVWKASINIVGRPSPKSRKSHLSLRLFGPLRPNIMFALTRSRHKRRKLSSHLILLNVIKYLMSYLNIVILNCHI